MKTEYLNQNSEYLTSTGLNLIRDFISHSGLVTHYPLARDIDARFGHLYLDKIFLSINFDVGNAWTGEALKFEGTKKGIGAELRIHMNSYYLFPTDIFFNASYGFDQFDRIVNNQKITYGKEFRFYGGILFGFDIVNIDNNLKF